MSYKNKKLKRSKINKVKFLLRLVFTKFFYKKIKIRKEKRRMIPVEKVMQMLRARNKMVRQNNLKISEWVEKYLETCFTNGKDVNILTQWCLSKALEKRFTDNGGKFVATKKERKIFTEEIPAVLAAFFRNGFGVNWWITFNRSFMESGLLPKEMERKYKEMIISLSTSNQVVFFDWEDDVLGRRAEPDTAVLNDIYTYIDKNAFTSQLDQLKTWRREEVGREITGGEVAEDVVRRAACEANEAKLLAGPDSPFWPEDFILMPLEAAERYDNFTIFVKDFKKRIVSVLSLYPWRMKWED